MDPAGQAADGAIGAFLEGGHVIGHQRDDPADELAGCVDAVEKRFGDARTLGLVARGDDALAPLALDGFVVQTALPKSWASTARESTIRVVESAPCHSARSTRASSAWAVWVSTSPSRTPSRVLRDAANRRDLREMFDPAAFLQKTKAGGGALTAFRPLEPLFAHALLGEFGVLNDGCGGRDRGSPAPP